MTTSYTCSWKQKFSIIKFFNKINTLSGKSGHGRKEFWDPGNNLPECQGTPCSKQALYLKLIITVSASDSNRVQTHNHLVRKINIIKIKNIIVGCIFSIDLNPCMDLNKFNNDYFLLVKNFYARRKNALY